MQSAHVSARSVWIVLGNALAAGAALVLLWRARTVVSWMLLALFFALAASPAVEWLVRRGFRRGWAVLVVFVGVLVFLGSLVGTLAPMLFQQGQELVQRAPDLLARLKESGPARWADERFGVVASLQGAIRHYAQGAAAPALAVAASLLHSLAAAVSIATLSIFMLLFGHDVYRAALAWISPERRPRWQHLTERMRHVVGGYVLGTFFVASIGGTVMGVTTLVLGVPYFLALGLVMVVLGVIPYLGSALGALLVVGVTFASEGVRDAVIALVVFLLYQQLENALQPLVQRKTIRMNPVLITVVLLLGTSLAGLVGTLLALPLAGAVQILLQEALAAREARWREAAGEREQVEPDSPPPRRVPADPTRAGPKH